MIASGYVTPLTYHRADCG